MQSYIGVRCPVCAKKFSQGEDIVVCPTCGAPHHRDCYMVENRCAFADDHISGKEWRAPVTGSGETAEKIKQCKRCKASNPPESIFCQMCGQPLNRPDDEESVERGQNGFRAALGTSTPESAAMIYGGLSPEDTIDGESVKDIACYIGKGSAYYLPRFQVLSVGGRVFMPNFSAFIFGFFYYFYRRMYLLGILLLILFIVSSIPTFLYTWELVIPTVLQNFGLVETVNINQNIAEHYMRLSNIARGVNIVIVLVFSMYSNRVYYGKTLTAVHQIRQMSEKKQAPENYSSVLEQIGGSSIAAVIIVAVALVAGYFGILSTMMNIYLGG